MTHNKVNPKHVGYTGSLRASGDESGDAWFTPPHVLQLVRRILRDIDLDPFSSDDANYLVGARRFFTVENSAFEQKTWKAKTIFMNPPYSRGLCQRAVGRLLHEFNKQSFRCALVLVNNMTDTNWYHDLARTSQRRCDFRGRIAFVTNDNKRISGNTRGQSLFLIGRNHHNAVSRFDAIMADKGLVYKEPVRSVAHEAAGENGRLHWQRGRNEGNRISGNTRLSASYG